VRGNPVHTSSVAARPSGYSLLLIDHSGIAVPHLLVAPRGLHLPKGDFAQNQLVGVEGGGG